MISFVFRNLPLQIEIYGRKNGEAWLICSSVSNHSMDQVMNVRKNFPYEVRSVLKTDIILCTDVNITENTILIANVYSPNVSK